MILVTGSRKFSNAKMIYDALDLVANQHGRVDLIVGDCPTGADHFTREWYAETQAKRIDSHGFQFNLHVFKADWSRKCDEKCYHPKRFKTVKDVLNPGGPDILVPYCPLAGHLRNQAMVDWIVSQDISATCLGFLKFGEANKGTKDCLSRAKKARFEIKKYMEW